MRFVAILLLVSVLVRHNTAPLLAGRIPSAGWLYILGGALEVVMATVIGVLLYRVADSVWKRLAVVGALIASIEGAQMSVCRFAISDISQVPRGANLCDWLTGLPIGAVVVTVYLFLICWTVQKK